MKRIAAVFGMLAVLATAGVANASNTTNYVMDGQFESPNGDVGPWQNMFGGDSISFLSTGGNPNGCVQISDAGSYGGIAYVNPPSQDLASLGLTAGQTYTFIMDMQIVSGSSIGGLKIESWTDTAIISDSGNIYPLSGTTSWATYTFTYAIAAGATHLNIVPLWGPNSTVNYDNIGVIVPGPTPVSVSITSPTNTQVVNSNFTITATATVYPGTVTNVGFYVDNVLAGNATSSPFGFIANNVAAGAHALKAIAADSSGNLATSSVVNITVTNGAVTNFFAYEPFNYTSLSSGTPVTGTGFGGNWSCNVAGTIVPNLTYANLPTASSALQSSSGYQLETLSFVPSVSTVWVSFLFQQGGDNGGNRDGFALEDSTGKGVIFAYQQNGAAIGQPALSKISNYSTVGTQLSSSSKTETYTSNNLYVIKLTYTGASLSSVALYSDPLAGPGQTNAPTPDFTVSSGFSGYGVLNTLGLVHKGAISITLDEIRVGTSYASVVGGNLTPTIPTTLALSIAQASKVSWTAQATNYYQPQNSSDGVNWNNLGALLYGNSVSSVFDYSPQPFYQVEEILPVVSEATINGGMELGDGFGGVAYWQGGGTQLPTQDTADAHSGTASASLFVTNTASAAQTYDLQQNLQMMGSPGVTGGSSYNFSFWAKSLGKNPSGGYIQQYKITWLNSGGGTIGAVGFANYTSGNGTWSQVNAGAVVAPATAANAIIEFYGATGGILNDYGGTLIDDVSLSGTTPTGSINILPATVQTGAVFTADLETNGVLATAASGSVTFKTNSVTENTQVISGGAATSTPTVVPASYILTAIYSGDASYIGSTNFLVVGNAVNTNRTSIITSLAGNQLTIFWPSDHTGWTLQAQTNSLNRGLSNNWFNVAGSSATNQVTFHVDPAQPTVFFRLKYP